MRDIYYLIVVYFLIFALFSIGWVKNLIKLTECDFNEPYKCEVVHGIGIFPVVGGITGWLDMGK